MSSFAFSLDPSFFFSRDRIERGLAATCATPPPSSPPPSPSDAVASTAAASGREAHWGAVTRGERGPHHQHSREKREEGKARVGEQTKAEARERVRAPTKEPRRTAQNDAGSGRLPFTPSPPPTPSCQRWTKPSKTKTKNMNTSHTQGWAALPRRGHPPFLPPLYPHSITRWPATPAPANRHFRPPHPAPREQSTKPPSADPYQSGTGSHHPPPQRGRWARATHVAVALAVVHHGRRVAWTAQPQPRQAGVSRRRGEGMEEGTGTHCLRPARMHTSTNTQTPSATKKQNTRPRRKPGL